MSRHRYVSSGIGLGVQAADVDRIKLGGSGHQFQRVRGLHHIQESEGSPRSRGSAIQSPLAIDLNFGYSLKLVTK